MILLSARQVTVFHTKQRRNEETSQVLPLRAAGILGTVRNFVWRVGCAFELGGFHSITEHDGELRSGLIPFA